MSAVFAITPHRRSGAPTSASLHDPEGFRRAALAHQDVLFRVAARMLGDDHAAEDVVQETFARAYGTRSTFRGDASARTWLVGITLNLCRGELRRRRVRRWLSLARLVEAGDAPRADAPAPDARLEQSERERALRAAMAKLPAGQREALVLVNLEGLSGQEAAAALGKSEAAVWQALSRGRAALRKVLDARA